ncbi:MAG: DNA mismatch repair protein [Fibrobacterota bacterium]|nr:DNA mismatch repair protein [Fibrobacterota bacterium]
MTQDPLLSYQDRRATFAAELDSARKTANTLSNIRLAVALAAFAGFLWFILQDSAIPALAILLTGIVAFIILMVRHEKVLAREKLSAQLTGLNDAGIQRIQGQWTKFPVDGREFADDAHPYASDLDLFGPASLFQWMNAAQTVFGRLHLRRLLTAPPRSLERIATDQEMVRELAPKLDWRQRFQAAGGFPPAPPVKEDPETLLSWAEDETEIFPSPGVVSILRFLPILSFALALYILTQYGLSALLVPPFLVHLAIAAFYQRRNSGIQVALARQVKNLEIYLDLMRAVEGAGFTGPALQSLAGRLKTRKGPHASAAILRLQQIGEHMETRLNPVLSFLVNALLLWDIQWLWAFRRWRGENGKSLRTWLDTLAALETLSSLALPAFENPDWVFPELHEGEPLLDAGQMAHPLIPKTVRVGNDLRIGKPGEVLIITGSNMSGKSTLMRTVGVNLVLAYSGAPVCAQAFRCARLEVYTSMRLKDDLEKRISSFYAELLRIKGIVEAAKSGKQVLFLVDEIFRGTNSKDRHEGAMTVLRQLHGLKAAGLVSTHDLELARLEELEPESFRNHHFQEQYEDGKIRFDYRMEDGVSRTTNAIHLIRMVGLGE